MLAHSYRSSGSHLRRQSGVCASSPLCRHIVGAVAGPSTYTRAYAVLVNKNSSVDPLLGVAPPAPPKPETDDVSTKARTAHAGQSAAHRSRPNNPNDLSELLRGNRFHIPGSAAQHRGRAASALGAIRRGVGSAIPTQDLENAFMPPDVVQVPDEFQTQATVKQDQANQEQNPQQQIDREHPHPIDAIYGRNDLDERILAAARALHHSRSIQQAPGKDASTLSSLLDLFRKRREHTLNIELPNESSPKQHRRVPITSATSDEEELQRNIEDGVLLIAYVTGLRAGRGQERISVCSGFAVEGGDRLGADEGRGKGALVVSCAHTLRGSQPQRSAQSSQTEEDDSSVALAITRTGHVFPISTLLSSLPANDLILLQLGEEAIAVDESSTLGAPLRSLPVAVRTLPVNPYPASVGSELCVSSFWGWEDDAGSTLPAFEFQSGLDMHDGGVSSSGASSGGGMTAQASSSTAGSATAGMAALVISPGPLAPPAGREKDVVKRERDDAGRSRWGRARLVEYRDESGREAQAGTYDELAQLDFKLLKDNVHNPPALHAKPLTASFPPPGSSGGPIVDAQTGAVVGITRGTKMGVLEGRRGDGIPAERIFFMFALPGFSSGKK